MEALEGVQKEKKRTFQERSPKGSGQTTSWGSKGPWKICNTPGVRMALPNRYFDLLGLPRLYRI